MALTNTHTPHSAINVLDEWGNNVRGSQRRPLKMITKSKCLDRNKLRERDFQEAPMQMDLGHVTASSGDGGKLQVPHVVRRVALTPSRVFSTWKAHWLGDCLRCKKGI